MLRKGMFLADRYEILDPVGAGGMSDVYKALDHKLNRPVAIKVLKENLSADRTFVSKFKAEAQSAAGLIHPNIVNVYDVNEENGMHYIVMELVEGVTLKKYIEKRERIPYKEAVSIAIQIAKGMEAAHENHIVHRDIKPQNIIISKEGKVKVTDFGIAKAASSSTINTSAMGSVHYISPEQARGGYADERSDIYSFGVTLYEMLTGKVPFDGDSTVSVAVQHIQKDVPRPSTIEADIPRAIDDIVVKCCNKKTERRYQTASELIADLKKSLVLPDGDFVNDEPLYSDETIISREPLVDDFTRSAASVSNVKKNDSNLSDDEILDDNLLLSDSDQLLDDEDIDDTSNDKLDSIMKWIGIGVVALIVIILLVVLIKVFGNSDKNASNKNTTAEATTSVDKNQVSVPDLSGLTEDEARTALNKVGLGFKADKEPSSTVAKGKVISQDKAAGTKIAKNTTITVKISTGEENISIPNVVGKKQIEASNILEDAGFKVAVNQQYSDTVDSGLVISQTPTASTQSIAGTSVTITVSSGAEPAKKATVPNVIGLSESAARQAFDSVGISVTTKTENVSSKSSDGKVIVQSIAAGSSVDVGSSITITVANYEEPKTEATTPAASKAAADGNATGTGNTGNNGNTGTN